MSNYLFSVFKPKLAGILFSRKYNKKTFISDLVAGMIVGVIALPLAIAFGIASGVTPQQGLITAIIAGFLTSALGGSRFLIGGPTGAFIVIIYGVVAEFGFSGLVIATVMAGFMLLIMGLTKMGNIIKFIPYPIVTGFTSGIALVIFSTQIKDFFGLSIDTLPSEFIPKWISYIENFNSINIAETSLAVISLVIIILWPYINKKIPGSLIAIILSTIISVVLSTFTEISFETIGSKFPQLAQGISLPSPSIPEISLQSARSLFQPALTIAILCAVESLLAAMVADGATGKKHDSNTELIGQGITNIITPFFGGIPSTGALARTMANINNGGKSPIAGIVHSIVLLIIFLFLLPYAIYIPLSVLAAILIVVAYNMSEWRSFVSLVKGDKAEASVLITTFILTVIVDLTIAIEVGILLAILLFVKRVSETSKIQLINDEIISEMESDDSLISHEMISVPEYTEIYEIEGPFYFGLATKIDEIDSLTHRKIKVRILRMRRVPFIDSTGLKNLRNLWKRSKKEKIHLILSGVNIDVLESLIKSGLAEEIGKDNICSDIAEALKIAKKINSPANIHTQDCLS